ncbi:MAG: methyltransferase domain-containing protein [Woeseiaceae bacterium]|nr:methyltransferase domain-containing protein [Woeseiaceae bacterium]
MRRVTHENEYHDNMVALLELIWGEGYMAPGGPGNVAKMLHGIDATDKRVLDIGCGIGGPAFEMARIYGAIVVGIDLEAPLVARATQAAEDLGLSDSCTFQLVDPGPLPFDDGSFDIVVSAGAVTQTENKVALLAEAHRVLKPGGYLSCYEWFRTDREYSDDMRYWFEMEGLTYAMQTIHEAHELLVSLGFTDVRSEDATKWYQRESQREYELMRGDLYPRMVELLGQADADHFVENWRAMTVVIDSGEMRQGYFRGRRPA